MTDQPIKASLEKWKQARFGMFIHWGLYSIHAGSWQGERVKGLCEWVQAQARIPAAEYSRLAEQFNPQNFDADFIARLAKDTGMRYLVITAKHHDGFAMFHSKVDSFNIVEATPFGRDIIAELAEASRRHGLLFGIYYSQDLDWNHPDGGGNDWDFDPGKKDFENYFKTKCMPQVEELLTNYGSVDLMWFDMAANISADQSRRLRDLVHSLQPGCLVSGRVGHGYGDYGSLGDNQLPLGTPQGDWETPATLNDSWGYKSYDHNWRSHEEIISNLLTTADKGVNYLLNIGPKADGSVPEPSVQVLCKVGDWMRTNHEAIYATGPNPFNQEFSWGWLTARERELYLAFHQQPQQPFLLPGLASAVSRAEFLGGAQIDFRQETYGNFPVLHLTLPEFPPDTPFPVIRLTLDKPLRLAPDCGCSQQFDGTLSLAPQLAEPQIYSDGSLPPSATEGMGGALAAAEAFEDNNEVTSGHRMGAGPSGVIENWYSTEDYLEWNCRFLQPGDYEVLVYTMARKYRPWQGGHKVKLEISDTELSGEITDDGRLHLPRNHHFEEAVTRLGTIRIVKPSNCRAVLHAVYINPEIETGLCLSGLVLQPAKSLQNQSRHDSAGDSPFQRGAYG